MYKRNKLGTIQNAAEILNKTKELNKITITIIAFILIVFFVLLAIFLNQNAQNYDLSQLSKNKPIYAEFIKTLASESVRTIVIEDPTKVLQDNPENFEFYRNAQKDDILFLLENQKILFLYRPSNKKIISLSIVE